MADHVRDDWALDAWLVEQIHAERQLLLALLCVQKRETDQGSNTRRRDLDLMRCRTRLWYLEYAHGHYDRASGFFPGHEGEAV